MSKLIKNSFLLYALNTFDPPHLHPLILPKTLGIQAIYLLTFPITSDLFYYRIVLYIRVCILCLFLQLFAVIFHCLYTQLHIFVTARHNNRIYTKFKLLTYILISLYVARWCSG